MATLTVLKFGSVDGAEKGLKLVEDLQKQALITIHDAAVVAWPAGAASPKPNTWPTWRAPGARRRLLGHALRPDLLRPVLWHGDRRLIGRPVRSFRRLWHRRAVRQRRAGEGHRRHLRAVLLTSDAVTDRVVEAAKTLPKFEIIATNLPKDQEDKLALHLARELLNGLFQTTETMTCATSR